MTVTLSDQKFSEIHQEITDLEEFGSSNQATLRLLSSLLNLENQDGTLGFADGNREEQQLSAIVVEALRSIRGKTQRVNNQSLSRWIWILKAQHLAGPPQSKDEAFHNLMYR